MVASRADAANNSWCFAAMDFSITGKKTFRGIAGAGLLYDNH
jgi:hypothetical protein